MLPVVTTHPIRIERSAPVDDLMVPHPLVVSAANGRLPDWAVVGPERLAHIERVANLLDSWAREFGLADDERARWRAAAYLHDALRDEAPAVLRSLVSDRSEDVPDALLHGPAAADRLRTEGLTDDELLRAIANHTIGDPTFGRLGRALYAADFLEPGRPFSPEWRAGLRRRAPAELDAVVLDVARARLAHLREQGRPLHPQTVAFVSRLEAEQQE